MKKKRGNKIYRLVGRAIHDYELICDKDRILVGVSGGQDSLILLKVLTDFQKRAPVSFDLVPVHVDPGFTGSFAPDLQIFIDALCGGCRVEYTDFGPKSHGPENRENPCFLCSRLRRKRLFEVAREEGCSKIALGHNKDDLIETLFLNIFFSGRIGTMTPCQTFFKGEVSIIRPLAYVDKKEIKALHGKLEFPFFENPCPSNGRTQRSAVRRMLEELYLENPHVKGNIFRAMSRVKTDYLLKQEL